MATGFVLIDTLPAREHDAYSELLKIKGIVALDALFGEHDFIAKVEAEDFNAIGRVVVDRIRAVKGVVDTRTLVGVRL
jgi:DNA-binding Lrp family transcriptional regulator